jgi:hypothetical protein
LNCRSNELTNIVFGNNPSLETVYCGDNLLITLDVSGIGDMDILNCTDNPSLNEIWLKKGQVINYLRCDEWSTVKYK